MRLASHNVAELDPFRAAARSQRSLSDLTCRLCGAKLHQDLIDFGPLPVLRKARSAGGEVDAPSERLRIRVCDVCTLVQCPGPQTMSDETEDASIDTQPAANPLYTERLAHLAAALIQKWRLSPGMRVIQVGSGDGMLLHLLVNAGAVVLGIDADASPDCDIPTERMAFGAESAMDLAVRKGRADVVVVEGMLPCVPDLFDFAAGLASIVRPNGIVTITVPYIVPILQQLQFDAFRHDVGAYFSLKVLERLLCSVGLRVFDAERLQEEGGLLRIHACPAQARFSARPGLKIVRTAETLAASDTPGLYTGFSARVSTVRDQIRDFVALRRAAGRRVAAYGVTPRGCMLLNVCGLTAEEVACVAGEEPMAFGPVLPGSHVPVVPVQAIRDNPPDDLLVLPWFYGYDVAAQLQHLRHRGMQCWALLPRIARV